MKHATMSNSKSCDHSSKSCVCGGHSSSDAKKNKRHNATKKKLQRRKERKFLSKMIAA